MDTRKIPYDEPRIDNSANCPDAGVRRSQSKRVSLRHVLRALAGDPESVAAPHMAIARLRLIVQSERARSVNRPALGAHPDVAPSYWPRFVDGTVIGLCHFARVCCDRGARSMVAPVAVIAAGRLGRSELCPDDPLDLVFLSSDDEGARVRAQRITTFVRHALINLGFAVDQIALSPGRCAQIVNAVIAATSRPCEFRLLWGQFALYSRFTGMLERAPPAPPPVLQSADARLRR